jgi:(1->4)-alpha-D-glucan 1-alpha-D-glucosylmutase
MEKEYVLLPRIPCATYRLQFNSEFTFSDAGKILNYLRELGISDIYASPYFKARKGSLHGYDIVDPGSLNPEIGTEADYDELINGLRELGMGQILDIVPNHMCIESSDNAWWMDVLENGPSSRYAKNFDIYWNPVKKELRDKVLIPVLGDQYGNVLEDQELSLSFEEGTFSVSYFDNRYPLIPKTYVHILKHRLGVLEGALSADHPDFAELLSIITALDCLPPYTETEPTKVAERRREKEIVKKRLRNLCRVNPDICAFIDENVRLFNGEKGSPESFDLLDVLLNEQAYRLSFWRVATEEINYRRFFDINSFAAIRVEDPDVFEAYHKFIMKLVRQGKVTGLRVDHPDGLYDPLEYFRTLQRNCFFQTRLYYAESLRKRVDMPQDREEVESEIAKNYDDAMLSDPYYKPFYIVGEKILIKDERMPDDWPIFSTTGYVFLNSVNGIFVRTENAKALDDIYERFTKSRMNFADLVYEKKRLITGVSMSSEINTLGHYLNRLSEMNRHTRDFTLNSLISAIVEVISFFPVYRTYINRSGVNETDRRFIEFAVSRAKRKNPAISASIFDFLKDVLSMNCPDTLDEDGRREWLDFVMRFQQITGPVMAKGVEDTVFYIYNRLLSLNEVGGSPDRFGTSLDTFHGKNIERTKFWPHALITTSTHDTKRSEDVRARINVLSEIPDEWRKCLINWRRMNKNKKPVIEGLKVPDRNEEYLFYQTLIGAWPADIKDEAEYGGFKVRIMDYMLKAVREAKVNTSWISPNSMYEDALIMFIDAVMNDESENPFLRDFTSFQERVSHFGFFNSLSQTLLKIASPGVPDFYQGTEIWNFCLVDPDNRHPVDYERRIAMLDEIGRREKEMQLTGLARYLTGDMKNGMIKLHLIRNALKCRGEKRGLFERGEYIPLEAMGEKADNVCAFARRMGPESVIVAAPRFFASLIGKPPGLPLGDEVWGDSSLMVHLFGPGTRYRNVFTGEIITAREFKNATALKLSEVFANFPAAMLESQD